MTRAKQMVDLSRRKLLIGGGVGVGLIVAWKLWPRRYPVTLRAAQGETRFNAFLKIGSDGRVIVAVPQTELGQGVYTSLPQIVADELGADWRTVSVEPAPLSPLYGNPLIAKGDQDESHAFFDGFREWTARTIGGDLSPMATGNSTSVRAYETRLREAGAAGRALLSKAAALRWGSDWETLDTHGGFVWNGKDRISFGELAEAAAKLDPPDNLPVRGGVDNRLVGQSLPRIDVPSKVDGSAQFAGDIRLADMLFGSVRQGPTPASRLLRIDRNAAEKVPGLVSLFEQQHWAGAVATTWWAANRAVEAMRPRFQSDASLVGSEEAERSLAEALEKERGSTLFAKGDAEAAIEAGKAFRAHYSAGPVPAAALETLTATVRPTGDRFELWAPTQAPDLARAAAARAGGVNPDQITLYPTIAGGGYGRKFETAAIEQAIVMAASVKRPIQLSWSRIEETLHDSFRVPAHAELVARLADNGAVLAWHARIATAPNPSDAVRMMQPGSIETSAVAGSIPPYAIPAVSIEYLRAPAGIPTGAWRSNAHSYTAFFIESFIDELALQAKTEALSFRMQMLAQNPRFARVLTTAAMLGGWDGGRAGSAMGLAAHSAYGSYAALLVEVRLDKNQRIRVSRAVCAVDCGRAINPEIVRQQVEGGILFGIAAATGTPVRFKGGLPTAIGFGDLGFPLLADSPDVTVEVMPSEEDPGGVTELAVPPVAPAIANAVFALTGQRLRALPLAVGGS